MYIPGTLEALEELGVAFSLDWDNTLIVDVPESLSRNAVVAFIGKYEDAFARQVGNRAAASRRCFVGGPYAGQSHDQCWLEGQFRGLHVKRGKWAVYKFCDDGRALFKGYASSEKKARRGEVAPVTDANAT